MSGSLEPENTPLAATAFERRARYIRERVEAAIASGGPMTADAVAAEIGEHILNIRPRVSELVKRGTLKDSGERGFSEFGRKAVKWILTDRTFIARHVSRADGEKFPV